MVELPKEAYQLTTANGFSSDARALAPFEHPREDQIDDWAACYFAVEATTCDRSRTEQRRDIGIFLSFLRQKAGGTERDRWTPRVSREFVEELIKEVAVDGRQRYSDRTINRILSTLRPLARWIHSHAPFRFGYPMAIKNRPVPAFEVKRALTPQERRSLLDAADELPIVGRRSRDRRRYGRQRPSERPQHPAYRPWRNRAIVYTLIETGMRRVAVTTIRLEEIDWDAGRIPAIERGGHRHTYAISSEGLRAIADYVERERPEDGAFWDSSLLFLAARGVRSAREGRVGPRSVSLIWKEVAKRAGVKGKGCHAARHAVGLHIIRRTGNAAMVQRQLGHRDASSSLQYCNVRHDDVEAMMDERE